MYMEYIFCWIVTQRANSKSANPSLTLPIPTASSGSESFHPVSSLFLGYTSIHEGQPVESLTILIRLFLLSSILLARYSRPFTRVSFSASLAANGVCTDGRGQRPKEKEKNQSWTRTVGPQNLPVTSPRLCGDQCMWKLSRARAISPVTVQDRSIGVTSPSSSSSCCSVDRDDRDDRDDAGGGEWGWRGLTGWWVIFVFA